jgi:hypothetical protein
MSEQRTMMIKNLCPGLAEIGKIKIGRKGAVRKSQSGTDWQPPEKLDHFIITTMERGADGNFIQDDELMKRFGNNLKSIPIILIYDSMELNFPTRYICYYGKTVFCSGDGEVATRLQEDRKTYSPRQCPCGRQDPKYAGDNSKVGPDHVGGDNGKGKCKVNGILSAIIQGADVVGGVWKFRTTSYNTVIGVMSSLALISRVTGGRLAGIPLNMTVSPKTTQDPIKGGQVTIQVVGLQYAGSMQALRDTGYEIAMLEAKHGISMQMIEQDARKMITLQPTGGLGDDTVEDVIEEFYPEEAVSVMTGKADTAPPLIGAAGGIVQEKPEVWPQEKQEEKPATLPMDGNTVRPSVNLGREGTGAPPVRERGKPSAGHAKRTKIEMAEDAAADARDLAAAQQTRPDQEFPEIETECPHPEADTEWQQTGPQTEDLVCLACGKTLDTREPAPPLADPGFQQENLEQPDDVAGDSGDIF